MVFLHYHAPAVSRALASYPTVRGSRVVNVAIAWLTPVLIFTPTSLTRWGPAREVLGLAWPFLLLGGCNCGVAASSGLSVDGKCRDAGLVLLTQRKKVRVKKKKN